MSEQLLHSENLTSVAIDGARISAFTARAIVEMDSDLAPIIKSQLLARLAEACYWLEAVRDILPVITTSVHIVEGG